MYRKNCLTKFIFFSMATELTIFNQLPIIIKEQSKIELLLFNRQTTLI